ncbi:MAG TPA: hypothetical protein VFJ02_02515 [Vicinamibacterales bacterium]|nr:hypothetical protein [Vicinamibacterales bacterium]
MKTYLASMTRAVLVSAIAAATAAAAGCIGYERRSTLGPSATGVAALLGSWTSSSISAVASSCTDFRWNATQQTGNTASGTFSATCAGDLRVSGTATGTLSGSTVTWNAQGTASVPNLPSCPITLTGTAELGTDSIRVPYTGDTCLGRVSGVEVLRKN